MRGLVMICVVYYHCAGHFDKAVFLHIFMQIFLSLFFFISGFVAYSPTTDFKLVCRKTSTRFFKLIVPTIVIGALHVLSSSSSAWNEFIFAPFHAGYWFTIVIFEFFVIYALMAFAMDRLQLSKTWKTLIISLLILADIVVRIVWLPQHTDVFSAPVLGLFSVLQILLYTQFFFMGVLAKMHYDAFMRLINNNLAMAIALIVWVVGIVMNFLHNTDARMIFGTAGILALFRIFHHYRSTFSSATRLGRGLSYIGQKTLAIYLLHYFFNSGLKMLGTPLSAACADSWIVEIPVILGFTMLMIGGCLLVDKILQAFPIVHGLMLGRDWRRK